MGATNGFPRRRREDGWLWVAGAHGDPTVAPAQRLQRTVYEAAGFVPDRQRISEEGLLVDQWSDEAWHIALHRDGDPEPVGHLRLIDRSSGPLPAEVLCPDIELPVGCWEVSALAVCPRQARRFDSVKRLYREAFYFAEDQGCTHWVGLIEPSLLRILGRLFRFPMEPIGPEIDHEGTPNLPALMSFEETYRLMRDGTIDAWFAEPWMSPPVEAGAR